MTNNGNGERKWLSAYLVPGLFGLAGGGLALPPMTTMFMTRNGVVEEIGRQQKYDDTEHARLEQRIEQLRDDLSNLMSISGARNERIGTIDGRIATLETLHNSGLGNLSVRIDTLSNNLGGQVDKLSNKVDDLFKILMDERRAKP